MSIKKGDAVAVLKVLSDLPSALVDIGIVQHVASAFIHLVDGRVFTNDGVGMNTTGHIVAAQREHYAEMHRRLQKSNGQQPE